jgi:hypothetical protein
MPGATYITSANERVTLGANQRATFTPSGSGDGITINIGYVRDARTFAQEVGPELERWRRRVA